MRVQNIGLESSYAKDAAGANTQASTNANAKDAAVAIAGAHAESNASVSTGSVGESNADTNITNASTNATASTTTSANASMPIIGIVPTQNPTEQMVVFPERYAKAIIRAQGAPLLLPISGDPRVYETLFPLIDGFVLTGGNDIDPARYGAIRDSGKISEHTPEREELEYLILSYAHRFDLPLLGICRGMQMMNVCLGGTLYRDLTDQFPGPSTGFASSAEASAASNDIACDTSSSGGSCGSSCSKSTVSPHVASCAQSLSASEASAIQHWQNPPYDHPTHTVAIKPHSRLAQILQADTINVNSMHHQGICKVSPEVDAVAFSPDGLVEAIEVKDSAFMVGVQWHPEFFGPEEHRMELVFQALIQAAKAGHARPRGRVVISPASASSTDDSDAGIAWPSVTFADYI